MKFLSIASVLIIGSVSAFFTGCSDNSTNPAVNSSSKTYDTLCSSPEYPNGMAPASSETSFGMNKLFTWKDEYGVVSSQLFMNKPIADTSVMHMSGFVRPSILVLRKDDQGKTQVYGFVAQMLNGPVDKGVEGQMYGLEGVLRDIYGNVVGGTFLEGDRILFNVPWSYDLEDDGNAEFDYTSEEWAQLMAWAKLIESHIASSSGEKITGFVGPNAPHVLSANSCSASL